LGDEGRINLLMPQNRLREIGVHGYSKILGVCNVLVDFLDQGPKKS